MTTIAAIKEGPRTALNRARTIQAVAMAGAWREGAAHLASAIEVIREIRGADGNGDSSLAKGVIAALSGELSKIEERLGEIPQARPAEPGAGEFVDTEHAAKAIEARAEHLQAKE